MTAIVVNIEIDTVTGAGITEDTVGHESTGEVIAATATGGGILWLHSVLVR